MSHQPSPAMIPLTGERLEEVEANLLRARALMQAYVDALRGEAPADDAPVRDHHTAAKRRQEH